MNVNELRELMQFADENQMFGRGWKDSASSYDPRGRRAMWAADMMGRGGQGQNFFQEGPEPAMPAYIQPERAKPVQVNRGGADPMRGQVMNFLAKYMGR